nr:class II lanthipeptide, LchA2/BrtA2 family [uncultured Lachnoclostridium sp.]
MKKFENVTGLMDLEELSLESEQIDENGGVTPTVVVSFVTGAVSSAVISACLPTTACSSKC